MALVPLWPNSLWPNPNRCPLGNHSHFFFSHCDEVLPLSLEYSHEPAIYWQLLVFITMHSESKKGRFLVAITFAVT